MIARSSQVAAVALALLTAVAAAQELHTITAEDYFTLASIGDLAVAPDGSAVAWVESRWSEADDGRVDDLWTVATAAGSEPVRLTFAATSIGRLEASRDGRWLYYDAPDDDDRTQVFRLPVAGGSAQAVTRVSEGVDLWDLSGDGGQLVMTVGVDSTDDEWRDLREEFADLEYGHGVRTLSEVRVLDLSTWRERTVAPATRVVTHLAVDAAAAWAALVTAPDNELIHNEGWSRVEVLDLTSGATTVITDDGWRDPHPSPYAWVDSVAMADDGTAVAFAISFDGYPTRLYRAGATDDGWQLAALPGPEGATVVGASVGFRPGTVEILFEADLEARTHLYALAVEAAAPVALTRGDVTVGGWAVSADGAAVAVVSGSLDGPDDPYLVEGEGDLRRLARVNPQVESWRRPTIELVRWTSADGTPVEGILELPPGWTPDDGPLPMVVEIHGGPTSATPYAFRFWIYGRTLLAARGYALLSPNYRGSTGYGDAFMTDLVGHENEVDVADILAGVDAMVARGVADRDRLGVMGWSNGGFLTNALIAADGRFRSASSGAGVIDQTLQWAIEDTPGHVINFMNGKLPWQDGALYLKSSPLYGLRGARTPTLIHVGADDERVPQAHARALYRALKFYLGVPTELVVYPGAAHGLSTYTHRRAKLAWDLAWFERYLGPGWEPERED